MAHSSPVETHSSSVSVTVPVELTPLIQELVNLYSAGHKIAIAEALTRLITVLQQSPNPIFDVGSLATTDQNEAKEGFLKSWQDILGLQVYVDTDIYGNLDSTPANAIFDHKTEATVAQHYEAKEAYVKSWLDIADKMAKMPDDLFNRSWSTAEIAKILGCSLSTLHKAKKQNRLPIKTDNFIVDCIGAKGRKILWCIRPL